MKLLPISKRASMDRLPIHLDPAMWKPQELMEVFRTPRLLEMLKNDPATVKLSDGTEVSRFEATINALKKAGITIKDLFPRGPEDWLQHGTFLLMWGDDVLGFYKTLEHAGRAKNRIIESFVNGTLKTPHIWLFHHLKVVLDDAITDKALDLYWPEHPRTGDQSTYPDGTKTTLEDTYRYTDLWNKSWKQSKQQTERLFHPSLGRKDRRQLAEKATNVAKMPFDLEESQYTESDKITDKEWHKAQTIVNKEKNRISKEAITNAREQSAKKELEAHKEIVEPAAKVVAKQLKAFEAGIDPSKMADDIPFSERSASTSPPISKRAQDPVRRTAESILKIINFLLFRVPQKDKMRYLQRIRGKILKIPSGQVGMKKMPQTASIGQSISLLKNILSGLNPFFVKRVIDELAGIMLQQTPEYKRPSFPGKRIGNIVFPFTKRAIEVVIEPLDPAVQSAVSRIKMRDPSILARVHKIVVHPGGGAELGHVQSGPQNDPQEIHLFKGKIEEMVRQQTSGTKPTPTDYAKALEQAIVEVIGHESGHIGPDRPEAQLKTQPFLGESEAEAKAKETVKKIYPEALVNAALELYDINCKFMPDYMMGEPDLSFMVKVAVGKSVLRDGLKILKNGSIPVAIAIEEACRYNGIAARQKNVARRLGSLVDIFGALPTSTEFASQLAIWQEKNGLVPTGKLDHPTLAHARAKIISSENFPRNFGIVTKGLYRGGQPDRIDQLSELKNKLGISRVVTLNSDKPEIAEWCRQLGLHHIHAPLENGLPNEIGWKTLGPSISKFILEMPTYIHCRHGSDRTGGVVARIRTETGWPCDLAYTEAKAFGLEDRFPDMIDRVSKACQHDPQTHKHPPIDTTAIRRILAEMMASRPPVEQNLLDSTPSDLHYTTDSMSYDSGAETILSPFSIRSVPVGFVGGPK